VGLSERGVGADDSSTADSQRRRGDDADDPELDAWLDAARAGDEPAFTQLYRHLQPRLRRYAASLVGDEADDVMSEAWLQIARDIRAFKGGIDGFRAWCSRIVRNRAMDHLRGRGRHPVSLLALTDLAVPAASDDTEAEAFEAMGSRTALRLISTLPREQAEAVLLRAVVGLDVRAAADVLGKSPAAVRTATHRGLKRLFRLLAIREAAAMQSRPSESRHDA
jgi:RNA polymerase sigma-70 factor (ECF subfamily)